MTLLSGKRLLIAGVANHMSLAAAIAKAAQGYGAEVIITYQENFAKHALRFAENAGIPESHTLVCDALDPESINHCFETVEKMGSLDGFVHCIAYSPPEFLNMPFLDVLESGDLDEAFSKTMDVSVLSFLKLTNRAQKLMPDGGSIATLTYDASQKVVENYNLMTGAKGALESYMRLLAYELGASNIRVNAVSASPVKTPSGLAVKSAYRLGRFEASMTPLGRRAEHEEIANTVVWLMSDLGTAITGQTVYANCGRNIVGMLPSRNEPLLVEALGLKERE